MINPKVPKSLLERIRTWGGSYNVNYYCDFLKTFFGGVGLHDLSRDVLIFFKLLEKW